MTENVGIEIILNFFFKIILFAGAFFLQISSFAQNTNTWSNAVPNTVSPLAYEFTKYGDVPVSTYTGVPSIDVPIYTIQAAGLDLPIGISYHSNGIRVSEEASWVGLGWNLNAGGSIVQVVNEYDDFGSNSLSDEISLQGVNIPGGISGCSGTEVPYSLERSKTLDQRVILNMIDSEQDIFKFSFLNYSGEFLYDKKIKKFVCLDNTNIQITSDAPASGTYPQYFYISVPEGHKFVFQLKDVTKINLSYGITATTGTSGGGTSSPVNLIGEASSRLYQLTVIYTNKGEQVLFDYYQTPEVKNYPSISSSDSWNEVIPQNADPMGPMGVGPDLISIFPAYSSSYNFFATSQPNSYLKSITTDKVQIEFKNSSRLDIVNALKLDQILIKNKANVVVKSFSFTYDYFKSNLSGNTADNTIDSYLGMLNIQKTDNEKQLRLKLLSVGEDGINPYTFDYSSTLLPVKTSLAYDHWGYYNGQFLTSTLSNRNSSYEQYISAAILRVVHYPMGGSSVFAYEMNETTDVIDPHPHYNQESGKVFISDKNYNSPYQDEFGVLVNRVTPNSFWLLVPTNARVKIHQILSLDGTCSANPDGLPDYPNASWEIRSYNSQAADLVEYNGWSTIPSFVTNPAYLISSQVGTIKSGENLFKDWGTSERVLPAGVYYFNAQLKDVCGPQNTVGQYGFAFLSLEYTVQESPSTKGAGLRIQSILDLDESQKPIKSKYYTYEQPKLMSQIFYEDVQNFKYQYDYNPPPGGACREFVIIGRVHTKHSQPIFTPSSNASGRYVGYGKVTVKEYNAGTYNGKITYTFQNQPDKVSNYTDLPLIKPSLANGLVLSELYSSSSDVPIKEVDHHYVSVTLPCYSGMRTFWRSRVRYSVNDCQYFYENMYDLGFYPIVRTQTFLDESKTIFYTGTASQITTESLFYDSHNQVNKKVFTDSKGNLHETFLTYPYNFLSDAIPAQMNAENFITPVLTTEDRVNSSTVLFMKQDYKVIDQSTLFGNHSYFDVASISNKFNSTDALQKVVDFQAYDEDKLIQYVTREGVTTSFIWGYGKEYLVAKIIGATYSQCIALLNTSIINNPVDDTTMRTELNKLRVGLPHALVYTYTHKPLVGVSSITDPNGVTQSYEYDANERLNLIKDKDGYTTDYYRYNYFKR